MNIMMIKSMSNLLNDSTEEYFVNQMEKAKRLAQKGEEDDAIYYEDSKTDAENIIMNESEIKKIYVSLTLLIKNIETVDPLIL